MHSFFLVVWSSLQMYINNKMKKILTCQLWDLGYENFKFDIKIIEH